MLYVVVIRNEIILVDNLTEPQFILNLRAGARLPDAP